MFNVPSDFSRDYDTLLYRSAVAPGFAGTESQAPIGWAHRAFIIVQSTQFSHVSFWPTAVVRVTYLGRRRGASKVAPRAEERSCWGQIWPAEDGDRARTNIVQLWRSAL